MIELEKIFKKWQGWLDDEYVPTIIVQKILHFFFSLHDTLPIFIWKAAYNRKKAKKF